MLEEAVDGAGIAGGDAKIRATGNGLEAWIAMGGHFAEIGNGLEAGSGFAELAEDFVFHARGDDLGVGAAAVENRGGIRHSCSWGWGQRHELERAGEDASFRFQVSSFAMKILFLMSARRILMNSLHTIHV